MKLIPVLLLFFFFITQGAQAHAASFGSYPSIIQIKASQGAQVRAPITFINNSLEDLALEIELKAFKPDTAEQGFVQFTSEATSQKVNDFLSTVQVIEDETIIKTINLYPNESKTIYLTFPVATASEEEYTFALVAKTQPAEIEAEQTQINISAAVATLVFASINETKQVKPALSSFTTSFFHTSFPISLKLQASNSSDHFQQVTGEITIKDMIGRKTHTIPLLSTIIPAKTTRTLSNSLEEKQIFIPESFMFGLYTARATVSYENGATATKETRFVVFPIVFTVITSLVFFVVLGVILRVLKKLQLKER